ncbi:MAG: HDOD domain-containing protein [Planctomycetota bacterium]|nr:HDOD domain-containing protein [Planctomycetota bacterium]
MKTETNPSRGEPAKAAHVELILQQIASLPTLSPVAVRIMRIAQSGEADLREVARLIESDPAVTARVLALCRRADMGVSKKITTVDRAVVMLGLEAVRAALLSVEIHEAFGHTIEKTDPATLRRRSGDEAPPADPSGFSRRELWRHCLGVACAAETIAEIHPAGFPGLSPQEAFVAGLLHDLGKLALDALLPKSYQKVASLSAERRLNIAEVERRVLGLDHHAAGKRLAEHWGLPHALQDVMWLHGQPFALLPDVPHRPLVALVTIADALARRLHLGWSGNHGPSEDFASLCTPCGVVPAQAENAQALILERMSERARDLGVDEAPSAAVLVECITRANSQLGAVSAQLEQRARESRRSTDALGIIARFLSSEDHARSGAVAVGHCLRSAAEVIGPGYAAIITQARESAPWTLHVHDASTGRVSSVGLTPPGGAESLAAFAGEGALGTRRAAVLTWLSGEVAARGGPPDLHVIPMLLSASSLSAVLVHERAPAGAEIGAPGLSALAAAWGASIASALRHDGARRLSEQLAEVNRELAEAQNKLVEQRSMLRLGELAAGAAHEMNNPLTVISGMAQMLSDSARTTDQKTASAAIVSASEKLTELITSLHLFADPPKPHRAPADLAELLAGAVRSARQRVAQSGRARPPQVRPEIVCDPSIGRALIDRSQISLAVTELIVNALQAGPRRLVQVRAQIDPFDGRLVIAVSDDGSGMSSHALEHAFDPFFSELPAGRRTGLGLTRARRYVDLHGGELTLESVPGKGTTARLALPDWRPAARTDAVERAA